MAAVKSPFADPSRPTAGELRRWQAGFRRAERRQRELAHERGVDRKRAVRISLDLLDAALAPGSKTVRKDAVRRRDEARVRGIWRRLRSGFVR